jgi:hypothetical protein
MAKSDNLTFDQSGANTITLEPQFSGPPAIDGLDELAAELGVKPGGGNGIVLQGKSGEWYDWVAILAAHLREMRSRG